MRRRVRKHYGMYQFMHTPDSIEVRANRIDAGTVDKEQKRVLAIEMSCPWLDNREVKEMEKTQKYGPLMWELREREILATK